MTDVDTLARPLVMIHDAFQPLANWEYFFSTTGSTWINYAIGEQPCP